ncbi:MAG TPA: hypothetical protein VN108_07135 [Marmoricola sp.]|nr:hypothetical protein [Marmoricola sp.]
MTRSLWLRLAALLLAGVGIVGTTTAETNAASGPMYGAPSIGTCFNITMAVANGAQNLPNSARVACSAKHTQQVFAVFAAPADSSVASAASSDRMMTACSSRWTTLLGGGAKAIRSSYWWWEFTPTKAQQAMGAHWVMCTTGIQVKHGLLATTKGRVRPLPQPIPAALSVCLSGNFKASNCVTPHMYHVAYTRVVTSAWGKIVARSESICAPAKPMPWSFRYAPAAKPNAFAVACFRA